MEFHRKISNAQQSCVPATALRSYPFYFLLLASWKLGLGVLETRLGVLEAGLGVLEARLGVLEASLGVLGARLGVLESRMGVLEIASRRSRTSALTISISPHKSDRPQQGLEGRA